MSFLTSLRFYNNFKQVKRALLIQSVYIFLTNTVFVRDYYRLNELIWQDGFLIDFLQKKVIDKWLRKFVIYSGYLYSERMLFDFTVKFYLDLIITTGHYYSIFEFNNVASTLLFTLFLLLILFLLLCLIYVGVLIG